MKRRTLLASAAMGLALAAAPAFAQDKPKIAFVYVGPVNDGGWSQHHHEAAVKMKEHFGDAIEMVEQESVPEGADAERVLTQMALSGADLIFTTSFGYMDPTINVAAKFPDVKFEHATGYKTAENVSAYSARFYEGRAITGYLAGAMTKSNKIGYIGSFPIPEVIRGINSSFLHAKKANPDVEMSVVWLSTWFDPAKEADATQALLDQGVDVVLAHTDSTAPLSVLEKAGGFGFGQAGDMYDYAPQPRLSSIIDEWAPYYIDRVQAIIDGTWTSQNVWQGIGDGMVGIGEITGPVPEDVKSTVLKMKDDIAAGTYHPFTGPINKQDGSAWLADGEVAEDGVLAGMDFYVEGLTAEIPN
ncbi:BMP family ABC transporter substrate-binding protein [Salipiger mangrovisoli]|uniref:BMP family ABC transporter substrate-binding protein n=1 Tax=Salipiger mangrovisoli TaxID=2865933 RepID=A0ABR9X2H4_9RHOB|nr:BMP family ABC transporter substrate-binding protein [Salipiger mangrovisoli]MBE9637783.1 BMP family ABC transporter substrate-binding protein [Salipiger mangrovisoli]